MTVAVRKKAPVLSLTSATFSVEMKVSERRKYGMSDWSVSESEKEKAEDYKGPTKKWHTKPSAPKGKQRSKLKRYRWRSMFRKYRRHSGQFRRTMDCVTRKVSRVVRY